MSAPAILRTAWPSAFPDVVIHTDVRTRDSNRHYAAAKSGDVEAALALAMELVNDAALEPLWQMAAGRPFLLLPVVAEEAAGFNAIPDAMAQVLGWLFQRPHSVVSGQIVQTNKVGHTRARAFQRFVTPAVFDGPVERGTNYILIDDHVGLGGTLANLRGYVECRGGHVIGMTALTESRDGRRISLRPQTLDMLRAKHGEPLNQLWQDQFGYGLGSLTELEAQILCRQPSLTAIEDFLAQAAVEARGRGLEVAAERR
jgi:adenine/guanine phosphoribosyltransferase-like PRPP-binding protein